MPRLPRQLASSGASNSFAIHAEYRFSVARFQVLRNGQMLPGGAVRRRRLLGAHDDVVRDRAAAGRRAVARERRVPRPRGRRGNLGEPEIRRPAVPLARFGRDAAIGRDQRKLALERLLRGDEDAQRRALPRRDRRGQDRESRPRLRSCRTDFRPVRPPPGKGRRKMRLRSATMPSRRQRAGVLEAIELPSWTPPKIHPITLLGRIVRYSNISR